jgi:hypothetical protein
VTGSLLTGLSKLGTSVGDRIYGDHYRGKGKDMSDVSAEFRRVQSAYEQPTLTLISRPSSAAITAIFRIMFSTENPTVPTARMHDQVDALLADLRRNDFPGVPTTNGRDACQRWMRDGWLTRIPDGAGEEVYSLTSSALDGLRTVERLTKDRSISLSSHLISGLIRHLRDFSATVTPDRDAYLDAQRAERDRIEAEIKRVRDGGELLDATDDDIIQGFTELQRFLEELPSDFSRVAESYREFESRAIAGFRTEPVSSGEAVRRYLTHAQELATSSAAGRGFEGALQLLRDPELLDQVNRYLETLLADDRAAALLRPEERQQIRNTVTLIRDGLARVLEQRSKVSRSLHDYITSHDVERDHELAATLRELEAEVHTWIKTAGPRAKAPAELLHGKLELAHLRTKMYDPANDQPPPPLPDLPAPDAGAGYSLADLRARGGPSHEALRDELGGMLADGAVSSLADMFHLLPDDLRRPVEVLGVLPLARRHGLEPTGESERYETVRPDGTRRLLSVPRYAHTSPDASSDTAPDPGPVASTNDTPAPTETHSDDH